MPKTFSPDVRAELEANAREMELTLQAVDGLAAVLPKLSEPERRAHFYNVGVQVGELNRRLFRVLA